MVSHWLYKNKDHFGLEHIVLNEINTKVYNVFNHLKNNADCFYNEMVKIEYEYLKLDHAGRKQFYYELRKSVNTKYDPVLFYAVLKLCFNGVYQQNKSGEFNTSFGDGKEKAVFDHRVFYEYAQMLQICTLYNLSYEFVPVGNDGLIYLDPPYINSNTRYANEFDQHKFIEYVHKLNKSTDHIVMVANKQHEIYFDSFDDDWLKIRLTGHYTASRGYTKQYEMLIVN